jgi:hypothetical protein
MTRMKDKNRRIEKKRRGLVILCSLCCLLFFFLIRVIRVIRGFFPPLFSLGALQDLGGLIGVRFRVKGDGYDKLLAERHGGQAS